MSLAADERAALARALAAAGPAAPTACAGWTAADLAVHLLVRETRPDAAAGILLPALAGHLARVSARVAALGHGEVVARWAAGPPRWSPLRPLDEAINAGEHFIHHEDLRRGAPGWAPRELPGPAQERLHGLLGRYARLLLGRRGPAAVELLAPDRAPVRAGARGPGAPRVAVTGEPGELLLWVTGRPARVAVAGDAAAVHRRAL